MSSSFAPPAPATLPEAEGVTIGRTVSLDARAWRRHGDDTFFGLDQPSLVITGQGYVGLDAMTHIHRFYTDEEVMLQIGTGSAEGGAGDDITIFHSLLTYHPRDSRERAPFLDAIRKPRFAYQGVTWDRFWLPGYENDQEPVQLWEAVWEDRYRPPVRNVAQTCMLYSRELNAGGLEMLLALEVAPEHGEIVQELMVGIALSPAEFNA